MKKLILIAALLAASTASAAQFEVAIGFYACKNKDTTDALNEARVAQDMAEFGGILGPALTSGECVGLQEGEMVNVRSQDWGSVEIRRRGETFTRWTPRESIRWELD